MNPSTRKQVTIWRGEAACYRPSRIADFCALKTDVCSQLCFRNMGKSCVLICPTIASTLSDMLTATSYINPFMKQLNMSYSCKKAKGVTVLRGGGMWQQVAQHSGVSFLQTVSPDHRVVCSPLLAVSRPPLLPYGFSRTTCSAFLEKNLARSLMVPN